LDLEAYDYSDADGAEHFRVRVARSPMGEQRLREAEEVKVPDGLRRQASQLGERVLDLQSMIAFGEQLTALLFPPLALKFLRGSYDYCRSRREKLRIRLILDNYKLADLPWEYIYLQESNTSTAERGKEGFLALDARVSLTRYEELAQPHYSFDLTDAKTLRLVALLTNSQNEIPLDLAAEEQNIRQAIKGIENIQSEFHTGVTVETLQSVLWEDTDILHFAGHGRFKFAGTGTFSMDVGVSHEGEEGEGYLMLSDTPFSASDLALNVAGRGTRLAVLNACEGSRRDGVNAWTGIAPVLIREGVPAVVGMQYKIRDLNSTAFSRAFYSTLAAGHSVDDAVTNGRRAISSRSGGDPNERDWGAPVLYLRAEDGLLFPKATRIASDMFASLADLMSHPHVRAAVEGFQDNFVTTRAQIKIMSDYKSVHDLLHDLQFLYYRLLEEAKNFPDTRSVEHLTSHGFDFERIVYKLLAVVPQDPDALNEISLTQEDLERALRKFKNALDLPPGTLTDEVKKQKREELEGSLRLVTNVIDTKPTAIDIHLKEASNNLRLPELTRAMQTIGKKISEHDDVDEDKVAEVNTGIAVLDVLNGKIVVMVQDHNNWQMFDSELRRVESRSGVYLEKELDEYFEGRLKRLTLRLCVGNEDQPWAVSLKENAEKLEGAIKERVSSKIKQFFRSYRNDAAKRFYEIDYRLNMLCGEVREVGDALGKVLTTLSLPPGN